MNDAAVARGHDLGEVIERYLKKKHQWEQYGQAKVKRQFDRSAEDLYRTLISLPIDSGFEWDENEHGDDTPDPALLSSIALLHDYLGCENDEGYGCDCCPGRAEAYASLQQMVGALGLAPSETPC